MISLELITFWISEIISALMYVNKLDIVHRDIKPENILFDDDFHVKVCDFGTAKYYSKEEAKQVYEHESCSDDSDSDTDSDTDDDKGGAMGLNSDKGIYLSLIATKGQVLA